MSSFWCPDIDKIQIKGQHISLDQINFGLMVDTCLSVDPSNPENCEN